ncbi:uncharacterized protein KQ657_004461 [Scheffersomyces spartinae]|uniref:Aldehyde dehydrogenase n=1 Tax=Scheffersomyces spartinae TaxID=45513 RepID=A0A9P7VBJ9_9ASCO|nr:uncharacterized protein KQ657_004461 [Scheffersomyces spartinae]KAG7194780.1 hypothetical protein KQ657_004461 [Scheffersomyces spartinae]
MAEGIKKVSKQETTVKKVSTSDSETGPLDYTPLKEISFGVQRLRDSFVKENKLSSVQFRLNQLRNLYFAIKDNGEAISRALEKDFYRSPTETKDMELNVSLAELVHTMANLHKWVKKEPVKDVPFSLKNSPVYVERIPLGVVLIITPFNYPLFLSLSGIIGALAAGNSVVMKTSELTPHFSQLFTEIITSALDPDIYYAVNGAVPETTELLNQKFDKIMYTGNNMVGTIIAKKAAETLTPVILELGGKSPGIILDDVKDKDLPTIARRIAWGRFTNAGQTCVAVDYVLVPEKLREKFVKELTRVVDEEFFVGLNKDNKSYTHIIHERAFKSLYKMLETTSGTIVTGGYKNADAATRYIPPLIVDGATWEDSTMKGEIFGPILPIVSYANLDRALSEVITRHDTPLAQYIFTSGSTAPEKNALVAKIARTIRSGGLMINDTILHVGLANAPFGGIGESGYGAYHGWFSFRNFTHERTTIEQPLWKDITLKSRYPPYSDSKSNLAEAALLDYGGKVWFGRKGNVEMNGPSTFFSVWTTMVGVATIGYLFVTS